MNNKKHKIQTVIGLAVLGGLISSGSVQAGGFSTPTYGAPGWGRAFGGGSLFKNDPSAAFNNPAAMAFIDQNVAQMTVDYARIKMKFKGNVNDYQGNPASTVPVDEFGSISGDPVPLTGNGGEGGFTAWLPTGFMVLPINDRFAFGLSQVVPLGMRSTWDEGWKGRDFAVDTKIETVGLTGALSFKVREDFSIGAGLIVQHSKGFVSQNLNLSGAAGMSVLPGAPSGAGSDLMRVKVDNTSVGWFTGVTWKPTEQDTVGLNYHAKIKNKMEGKYNIRVDALGRNFTTLPAGPNGETLTELAYPGLKLFPDGANASTQLDIPATAGLDWVHVFNDRFTLGASVLWTQWSSFKDLTLKSDGNVLVAIPYKYKDAVMYSLGGDYKFTDQLTLRAGVAFDETPTRNSTRDPRIPDNDRWFTSLGFGYDIKAIPGLTIDGAYSRQFVKEAKLKTVNQDRLGGSSIDGKVESSGEVVSLSATYHF
ncbi:outer membrane protein transport protein [Pseudomonas sp. St29]|uniref:outer membrane protein transport protein n=1 Tax=Pseudomonas sp. St29 TaxID=1500687 RepID=UPI0005FCB86B|nr:outer membrane protein transport protein [Pseudomonas sp. St29]BAQ80912.1 long-chain fatty acid transporter [Pseudomonas sp. St29]